MIARPASALSALFLLAPVCIGWAPPFTPAPPAYGSLVLDGVPGTVSAFALAVGDLDGDAVDDFVVGSQIDQPNLVYLNDGAGAFALAAVLDLGDMDNNTHAVVLADFDRDDDLDLAVGNNRKPNRLYLNAGGVGAAWGGLVLHPEAIGGGAPAVCDPDDTCGEATWAMAVADLNADTWPDLVVGNAAGEASEVYLNQGELGGVWQGFVAAWTLAGSDDTVSLAVGDLDADGCPDIVEGHMEPVGSFVGADQRVHLNVPDGMGGCTATFVDYSLADTRRTRAVALADLNGDDVLDLITANAGAQHEQFFLGDGAGGFADPVDFGLGSNATSLAVADLDSDGRPEVVVGAAYTDHLGRTGGRSVVYDLRRGVGLVPSQLLAERDTHAVATIDADGVGELDLLEGGYYEPFPSGEPTVVWTR